MRLPPLSTLRHFEAVGRLRSVRLAAQELCVTPAAVSQQLRTLEGFLGLPLLERLPRGVALTAAGIGFHRACSSALQTLAEATRQAMAPAASPIVLSCTPGFAQQWLLPRIDAWQQAHPEQELRISTSNKLARLDDGDIDFAVRHGLGDYPGLRVERLVDDELVPVASPRLIAPRRRLTLADIAGARLLHDEHRGDWRLWLQAAGLGQVDWRKGPVFTDSNGAAEAAIAGQGIALLRRSFAGADIARRRLVALPHPASRSPLAYHLVFRQEALLKPGRQPFVDWLLAQR
jgi:LysR family glycine cleavage system transcriptional activator